jgi:hypothetical protein
VAALASIFGVLLIILGGGFYYATEMRSPTALIPAFFGIVLVFLGILASRAKLRMHAMHGAAIVGLLGFAIPLVRLVMGHVRGIEASSAAVAEQICMSVLCGVFLALCVKSFIDARRRRQQSGPEA